MASDSSAHILFFPESACVDRRPGRLEEQVTRYFEQFRTPVYCYLVATGTSPADAEEMTQETFLRLYRFLHTGGTIRNIRSWVFRVAHNLAVESYKKQAPSLALDAAIEDVMALADSRSDLAPDPEQRALQKESWMWLKAAWVALTPRQRQCLLLHVQGLRYRQIAEVLGIGVATVEDCLERSIAKGYFMGTSAAHKRKP